jgi:hypothetical protein
MSSRLIRRCFAVLLGLAMLQLPGGASAGPGDGSGQGGGGSAAGTITAQVTWWNAGVAPTAGVSGCSWELIDGSFSLPDIGSVTWPRVQDGVTYHLWRRRCPDGEALFDIPEIDPTRDILPTVLRRLEEDSLPAPTPAFALLDPQFGWAYVRTPLDFRAGGGSWAPVSVTASIGPFSATVTGTPVALTFDPGDSSGAGSVTCGGAAPVAPYIAESPGACSYTYTNASSTSAYDSYHYLTKFTIDWQISWTSSTGQGGPLEPFSTSATSELAVAEAKGIVTCTGSLPEQGGC